MKYVAQTIIMTPNNTGTFSHIAVFCYSPGVPGTQHLKAKSRYVLPEHQDAPCLGTSDLRALGPPGVNGNHVPASLPAAAETLKTVSDVVTAVLASHATHTHTHALPFFYTCTYIKCKCRYKCDKV